MSKKNAWISAVVVIVVVIVAGYTIFHNSSKTSPSSAYSSTSTSSSKSNQTQAATVNNSILITKTNSGTGNYLADSNGNTLYTDGTGTTGVTNCTSSCLSAWPVYQDKGATTGLPTNVSTIKRSDNGEIQYTYKGAPLYYFSSDSQGQVTGNGVSGFYVAKP